MYRLARGMDGKHLCVKSGVSGESREFPLGSMFIVN